jgi:hypothetical protein
MKISKKLTLAGLLIISFASLVAFVKVSAVSSDLSEQQIQNIRQNCLSIKTTLNQLHASDALLRVNRGQIYESMSIKLMAKFNDRVANNNQDNSSLTDITNKYNSTLDSLRSHYISYEGHLSAAISIDCSKQPVSFYDAVQVASGDREKVHSDINKLNQMVDQYGAAVNEFEKKFLAGSGGGQ